MTEFQGVRFSPGVRPKTTSNEDVRELLRRFTYASQQYEGLKRSIEYELTAREVKQQNMYECDGTIAVRKYNDAKRLKVMQARYVIDDDKYVI
jgi:ribosomal protein S21